MRLTDRIGAHRPFYTFEFFPPRTDQGFENLLTRIARLTSLHPGAISITWGAGGSTRERSLDLAGFAQGEHGVCTVLHLTCTNVQMGGVDEALRSAKERGIQNILALRGDPPRGEEYWIPTDPRFTHAIDLVSYIRSHPEFKDYFCIGVAAYPDGHTDAESTERDAAYLKQKVDAGADFIVTQLFYDVDGFVDWHARVRALGVTVPIIPGVAPIQSHASFLRMTKLCGTRVPRSVTEALEPIKSDDQKVKDFGVQLAISIIQQVMARTDVAGVHFCTLNLEKSVRRVVEGLGWSQHSVQTNKIIRETAPNPAHSHLPPDLLITASEASHLVERPHTPEADSDKHLTTPGSTWDDFPNGRFGDSTSPAYGPLDPWDGGGLGVTPAEGIARWGRPTSISDIRTLFLAQLEQSKTAASTPFSGDGPPSAETRSILSHLVDLTKRDWWTVASQPAIDGASSTDVVVGWGPKGGYVFQKAFVEWFCDRESVLWIEQRVKERGRGWVTFYAGNAQGELISNVNDGTRSAVTWGVFPGQEIAQPTVIERDSFVSWKDDTFSTWAQWALFYPPGSPERGLLEGIKNTRWLVSVVHHDFKDPDALWALLRE